MKKLLLIIAASALALLSANAQQEPRYGVVEFSANYMREEPGFSKENGNQALMGTVVEILDNDGYWVKIKSPEPYTAWAVDMGVIPMTKEEIDAYIAAPKFIVTAEISHVFAQPYDTADRVCDLVMGDLVREFTAARKGEIRRRGFTRVLLPSGKDGWVPSKDIKGFAKWERELNPTAENVIKIAKLFVGVPYLWGGNTIKGTDCSGLTRCAFMMNGILLPRNTSQQIKIGDEVDFSGVKDGDFSNLQLGDLVLFGNPETKKVSHVSIYIGDGHIIHSSNVVRINSLRPSDPDYYTGGVPRMLAVRRVLGNVDNGKGIISIKKSPWYFPQK
ncbi:MAG: C40 family peptidase [Bacteroidales bacterium]|nr:C40 family peptidase [Bacteroidales bacterium]MBQ2090794.1 C40 family peptidase [Bacteroidales bacterium]MCR5363478.1 C40 family peptidase [Bacteroidales bacterium]MDT3361546.1 C40 family peptidase [Bacteroidota bacterium]